MWQLWRVYFIDCQLPCELWRYRAQVVKVIEAKLLQGLVLWWEPSYQLQHQPGGHKDLLLSSNPWRRRLGGPGRSERADFVNYSQTGFLVTGSRGAGVKLTLL